MVGNSGVVVHKNSFLFSSARQLAKLVRADKRVWVDRMPKTGKMCRLGILPLIAGFALLLAGSGNLLTGAERASTAPLLRSDAATRARVSAAAVSGPLRFEKNVGQVRGPDAGDVRYVSRGSAYTLFLTSTEAVLSLRSRAQGEGARNAPPIVIRMRLSGARQITGLAGLGELPGKSNYFIGNDPSQWRTDVPNFSRVEAEGVYPGIDLVYHGNQGQLEYDFELAPRANPAKIRFGLEGARRLRVDSQGDLLVEVDGGELRFRRPVAYQKTDGAKQFVPVRYALEGKDRVEFRLASYDRRQALVIDPILAYSTYLGGSSIDGANGIAVAPDGTAFVAGGTFSDDFPTAHALQPNDGGPNDFPQDAFISKFSADGSTLVYSTYLGGERQDVANAIAVDAAGEAFVTGTTFSDHFPVTAGSINGLCGGDGECGATWNPQGYIVSNAFVAKINTPGSGLIYSTYLGYYEDVEGFGIAVDSAENAYVTGSTGPNIAPTVTLTGSETPPPFFPFVGGFEPTYPGSAAGYGGTSDTEAFIVKIDATGSGVLYASYLGGSDYVTVGYGVAVDSSANAYVTGLTYSDAGFPLTATATYTSPLAPLQATYGGAGDAFLSKVNTDGTGAASLLYSTYLGGSGIDQGNAVAVDTSGDAYIAGATTSTGFSFTPPSGAFQPACALDSANVCEGDAFVGKFNPALNGAASLLYFTYLGGSLADSGTGIAVDASGDAYVAGTTVSTNFPIFGSVFQPTYGGGNADAFVTELNPAASALIYSTYLGGSNTDTASGIAIDTTGSAYVTGQTCSMDFPLTNPEQPTYGGNCDAFVSKIIQSGGVSLSPTGLVFGSEDVGQQSAAQTVTLTNGAAVALAIGSIALSGDDPGDFTIQTNTCGSSVAALGTCAVTVTFTPTSATPLLRTANITFTDTETGGTQQTQVVNLTGTAGSAPIVALSASSLAFSTTAPQSVGATSAPLYLTVTNTGTAALTISSVAVTGDFAVASNTCAAGLQATTPPSNCTIGVTFTPNVSGSSVDSLTLTDNAPNSPQIILLTGTGAAQPVVSLSATSLSFGSVAVNSTSAAQTITVTNTGSAALTITSITPTASGSPFAVSATTCSSVAVGGVCSISVTFTPTAAVPFAGSVTITDNAANSPQTIALTGTGAAPADFSIAITPTSATVVAGNSASITVSITPVSGFNGAVTLACSGLPTLATCSASPASVTPSGTAMVSSTLSINTTQRTLTPPGGLPRPLGPGGTVRPGVWLLWAMILLAVGAWTARKNRMRWSWAALAVAALWLATFAACGSGGTGYVNPTGTPAGTYTVAVKATSGALSQSANFTLTVQ